MFPTSPLFFVSVHLGIGVVAAIQLRRMEPPVITLDVAFQLAVVLGGRGAVDELVALDEAEVVLAKHDILYLLTQGLGQSHVDLTGANNMLALLPLLGELHHFFNGDILTFQTVPLQMKLVYQVQNAAVAVGDIKQAVQAFILHHLFTGRQIVYMHVRDEDTVRVTFQYLPAVLHRRERFTASLGATKDHKTLRVKILRVLLAEVGLVPDAVKDVQEPTAAL